MHEYKVGDVVRHKASKAPAVVTQVKDDFCRLSVDFEDRVACIAHKACLEPAPQEEAASLRLWKKGATQVLLEWEKVWEAAGKPGDFGSSKAEATLKWVQQQGMTNSTLSQEMLLKKALSLFKKLCNNKQSNEVYRHLLNEFGADRARTVLKPISDKDDQTT